jgi:hypothetical protein
MTFALSGTTITQSGTDTTVPTASGNGFTVSTTNGIRTADFGTNQLTINGTFTVPYNTVLRNTGGNGIVINAGGSLIFDGTQTVNNVSAAMGGVLGIITCGTGVSAPDGAIRLSSANVNSEARLTIKNCEIRVNANGWSSISANTDGANRIRTEGDFAFINADLSLTGTNKKRLRINSGNPVLDLQATATRSGLWFNFGAAQTSVKGYTPVDVDGPEINVASLTTVGQVVLDGYNISMVNAAYYTGVQIVFYGGAWAKLKNFSRGTNMNWYNTNGTSTQNNVIEWSTDLRFDVRDAAGAALENAKIWVNANNNTVNFQPKGLTQATRSQPILNLTSNAAGIATAEYTYAMGVQSSGTASVAGSTSTYFCPTTTAGAEATVYRIRKYDRRSTSGTIVLASATEVLKTASLAVDDAAATMTEANAAAITGITITKATGTATPANPHIITITNRTITLDQIYCYWKQWFCQNANFDVTDELTANGSKLVLGNYRITTA